MVKGNFYVSVNPFFIFHGWKKKIFLRIFIFLFNDDLSMTLKKTKNNSFFHLKKFLMYKSKILKKENRNNSIINTTKILFIIN